MRAPFAEPLKVARVPQFRERRRASHPPCRSWPLPVADGPAPSPISNRTFLGCPWIPGCPWIDFMLTISREGGKLPGGGRSPATGAIQVSPAIELARADRREQSAQTQTDREEAACSQTARFALCYPPTMRRGRS